MRHTLLTSLLFLVLLACCGSNANPHGAMQSRRPPGKDWYDVMPVSDADHDAIGSHIMTTMGTTELHSSGNGWIVWASTEQVSRLVKHSDIKNVVKSSEPVVMEKLMQKRDDNVRSRVIYPTDRTNQDQLKETANFLRTLSSNMLWEHSNAASGWGDDDPCDQASKHPNIKSVAAESDPIFDSRTSLSVGSLLPRAGQASNIEYSTQKNAPMELVAISQPSTLPDITKLTDYVFQKDAGRGSFIYYIEVGVAFKKFPYEFAYVATEYLQTDMARYWKRDPGDPTINSPSDAPGWAPFHSTCTAGKALGQTFGVAKEATLVVVQMHRGHEIEFVEALKLVEHDLRSKKERRKHSVVTYSMGYDYNNQLESTYQEMHHVMKNIMDLDTPFVISAGNMADRPGRELVDLIPKVWSGPDFPLIVVGNVNRAGEMAKKSQRGPKVAIFAVGDPVDCYYDNTTPKQDGGTSFSAPEVAGQLAIWLARDVAPFDTTTGKVAQNALDYLRNSPDSGWARVPGVKTLWNGVKEEDVPLCTADFNKVCAGLGTRYYVERETLRKAIEDSSFCDDYVSQGFISRQYNQNTLEAVTLSIEYPSQSRYTRTKDDCRRYLLGELTDGCDAANNPPNWKAGGTVTLGDVTFRVAPQTIRALADKGYDGGCSSTWKGVKNNYWVWGHGWASTDNGQVLKDQLHEHNCALFEDTWNFRYGIGDDGREWTATFSTGALQRNCVSHAFNDAGGPKGKWCTGSG